jgi:hypothetical protein
MLESRGRVAQFQGSTAFIQILKFEAFTAVTMKNAVFWDINTQFVPHRKRITRRLMLCKIRVIYGILRRVAFIRTDVTAGPIASMMRVTRIGELGAKLAVINNRTT